MRDGTRRRAMLALTGLGVLAAARAAAAADERASEIVQPAAPTREAFMRRVFELRQVGIERGDQPYGAVVVRGGKIVGEGVSAVLTLPDPNRPRGAASDS